jgi:1-acyl-sn-glycerol-3-phosphate acyltransferase
MTIMTRIRGISFVLCMLYGLTVAFMALLPWIFTLPFFFKGVYSMRRKYLECFNRLYFFYAASVIHWIGNTPVFIHSNSDDIFHDSEILMLCNHRTRVDICFAWSYLSCFLPLSSFPNLSIILKSDLKNIPIFGWCMQMVMYIFLNRDRSRDLPHILNMMSYFHRLDYNSSFFLFPEGTDLSEERKKEASECKLLISCPSSLLTAVSLSFHFLSSNNRCKVKEYSRVELCVISEGCWFVSLFSECKEDEFDNP